MLPSPKSHDDNKNPVAVPPNPPLSIMTTCDDCGACCRSQGAPPDYVALKLNPHFRQDASFAEDAQRLDSLTGEPLQLLEQYLLRSTAGDLPTDGPCVWLDQDSRRCRFYELRPSTCRIFAVDSPGCHEYRRQSGIDP